MAERPPDDPAQDNRRRLNLRLGPVIALIAIVLIWTVLSYEFVPRQGVCSLLQTIEPGATFHRLTQAEMDAITARCNRPNWGILIISLAGYVAITGVALRSLLGNARPAKPEGSAEP